MDEEADRKDTLLIVELGAMPGGALITEEWMARRFDRDPVSVRRAVKRGELPAPFILFGKSRWTAGALIRHFEKRIEQETKILERERATAEIGRAS